MPELPEVQTVVDGLNKKVLGQTIQSIKILREIVVRGEPKDFVETLKDKTILNVFRRGKYIIFELSSQLFLISHLRMTGKFIVDSKDSLHKFDRVHFKLTNDLMIFSDIRCFGTLEIVKKWQDYKGIKALGIEPLSSEFNLNHLKFLLKRSTQNLKAFLMDQTKIAGIGNIYASEILFDCKTTPQKLAKQLKEPKIKALFDSIKQILNEGLKHNGTSISDFRNVDDKTGEFQNFLKVYGKKDQPCSLCKSPITKIIQQQRSTFCCEKCQK